MMHPEVERVIDEICTKRGISKDLVMEAVEDSMRSAVRKQVGMQYKSRSSSISN
jgi:hypothetical protein